MNTYRVEMRSLCPNNDERDVYTVYVTTDQMVQCEDIVAFAQSFDQQKVYQEDLTKQWASHFKALVKVCGWHCHHAVYVESEVDGRA